MVNTQKIPWNRLSIEAAAIVASILLAFAIDAWWSDRTEESVIAENLFALKQEISRNLDVLENSLSLVEKNFEKLDDVFRLLTDANQQSLPEEFADNIGDVYMIWEPDLTHSAFDVVLSPGNLRLVENSDLRIRIVQTNTSILDVSEMFDLLWDDYSQHQAPFLKRHFVVSDFGWNEDQLLLQRSGLLHPVPKATFSADDMAIRTREFWNLLYHWRATYLDAVRTTLEAKEHHQGTLEILESEIEKYL